MIVIFLVFFAIYREHIRPSLAFLLAVLAFALTGILNSKEVLAGFSNDSIASIILLILITAGLRKNFNLELLFDRAFKSVSSYRVFLFRMMSQVALLSSIINNTPVVALMTPYVFDWGRKHNIAPSRLLIPLSYATIMGGMITLIGTSTTLVLNGFLIDYDQAQLNPYHLLFIGFSVTLFGILFIAFIGYRLLPANVDTLAAFKKNRREYLIETELSPASKFIDQSVTAAGLRNLKGVYLVEIIRGNKVISPVKPSETINKEDVMIFAGNTGDVMDLVKPGNGLTLPKDVLHEYNGKVDVVEAVISNNSSLIGKKVKETDFRNRYDAAIVAIHRNGEKLRGKIGEVRLSPGDLLLIYAGSDFFQRADLYRDIYVVNKVREINSPEKKKVYALVITLITAIILMITGQLSLFASLLIIFSILVGFKMISVQDIKREIDLNLIAILVFSLAIGQAIIKTNAANLIAAGFIDILFPYGVVILLIGLLLFTTLLTSFVTNIGAISITFPLAYSISQNLGIEGMPFYLAITYAASAAFLTPIGYQTNLIIFGPGGYKFKDFFRIGLPVTILYLTVATICILLLYPEVFNN